MHRPARLDFPTARRLLHALPVPQAPGLTAAELDDIEQLFGFQFNPDHRTLLRQGLPVGPRWPDWRAGTAESLTRLLRAPADGVLFDVETNGFWWPAWGARPTDPAALTAAAAAALTHVPRLIPVYGRRYAPALPMPGLPVYSVMQTDVICYGSDLANYLQHEFDGAARLAPSQVVPFWGELAG
jgi:hypothetical protein